MQSLLESSVPCIFITGMDRIYVDATQSSEDLSPRSQSSNFGFGWYGVAELPTLIEWLDKGGETDQALAEDIYQAYSMQMHVRHSSHPRYHDRDSHTHISIYIYIYMHMYGLVYKTRRLICIILALHTRQKNLVSMLL